MTAKSLEYEVDNISSKEYNSEYYGFENIAPYNKISDGKWYMLSPSPIGSIINERFDYYYSGKLMWREINLIKEKMDNYKRKIVEYNNKCRDSRKELINSIKKEESLCNDDCLQELKTHIDICKSTHKCDKLCESHNKCYTCDENYVAYECQFKENGRCSHYYAIKKFEERLEDYEYMEDEYTDSYLDYKIQYERVLAIKEDRYDEYCEDLDDY